MNEHLEEIRAMAKEYGVEQINFLYHEHRPTITKDGITYEILGITLPGEGENTIDLDVIAIRPSYVHKLVYLKMDETWRKPSWYRMSVIVETEIHRWYGE